MAKLSDILTSSSEVRNETASEQNTALRVGNVLYSLTQYLQQYTSMADITLQVSAVGATITAKFQSGDDRLFQKTIALPVASGERAGILTAEAYAAFQSDISKLQSDLTALFNEKEVLDDRVNVNAENIADLGLALRGKSANSSAYTDPFISLGESTDWSEFSGKLNALSDQKYMGRCRATVSGITVEIYQFINNFDKKDYTQVLLGNVSAVGSGVTFTPNQFNIIHRHRKDGVWLSWKRINDHPTATPSLDGLMSKDDKADLDAAKTDIASLKTDKADKSALNTANTEISDLRYRLQGRADMSEKCSAYTDPFISLGESTDWSEFSGKLNALSDQKYMGRCRATVSGITVEIYQFINNFEKKDYTQVLLGNVSAVGSGVTFTPNQFNIIHRHRKDGVWLSWQRINDHPIATSSLDGLMSASDKKALNSIDSAFKNLEGMNFIEASEYCANFDNIIEKVGGGAIRFSKPTIFTFSGAGSEQGMIINSPSSGGLITQFAFLKASANGGFSRRFIQYNINSLTITKIGDWRPISDLIPAATTSAPGLMSKDDKTALEKAKTDIASLKTDKAEKSALNTANTEISDLRYRLQGRADMSEKCSAYTDPFISLGDLANWPDFNDKLNAISDKKYMGRCRARVDGVTVEVYQFINSFGQNDYTQMIFGNVSAEGSVVKFTPNKFSIIYRQYKDSAWSAWQRMATATELATLEARIAALEARLS